MRSHAEMDMGEAKSGSKWSRLTSPEGFTAISHYFVMDWAAIWRDIADGLFIAGALAAWIPDSWWKTIFFTGHGAAGKFWGPFVGPVLAVISFAYAIGNVPLAAVLWNGGISFGGAMAFIFADLILLPILNVYRKDYGLKMSLFLLGTFYAAIVAASLVVEFLFQVAGLVPQERHAHIMRASVTLNYTTVLNVIFLLLAAVLAWRFLRTNGLRMLRMMDTPPKAIVHD
jgi:uncharacterized membrane protein YraQ (UPF0718 family)